MDKSLTQFLEGAALGVLFDLHIGGDGSGVIPEAQRGRVIHLINRGVQALYEAFPLMRSSCLIQQTEGRYLYPLRAEHAVLSGSASAHFILDDATLPFEGRVLKIEHLYDAEGTELSLNDALDETSWFTPVFDTLRAQVVVDGAQFHVEYRMGPAPLVNDPATLDTQLVLIPPSLDNALYAYVGWQTYASMNMEGAMAKAAQLKAEYELACLRMDSQDLAGASEVVTNLKPTRGGWI